jgi:hypothetical protein
MTHNKKHTIADRVFVILFCLLVHSSHDAVHPICTVHVMIIMIWNDVAGHSTETFL